MTKSRSKSKAADQPIDPSAPAKRRKPRQSAQSKTKAKPTKGAISPTAGKKQKKAAPTTGKVSSADLVQDAEDYLVLRLPRTTKTANPRKRRKPARFVTIAWGFEYVDRLTRMTIPALLAPGNLPVLVEDLDVEVAIVTESDHFAYLSNHPTIEKLREICAVRLVSMDDLFFPRMYGLTITLGNFRGFEDLGDKMTDYYIIFIFADFILGDGSYTTLAKKIRDGEKLILAPSYRTLEKKMEAAFLKRMDFRNRQLSVPCREMAGLILEHRHYTIRAKTINQRLFHQDLFEQFYIQVDDNTLICRQNPFALVCMKPERPITGINTFWDYGILAEACPNTKICALGDSDDFLMAELQEENISHTNEVSRPGWLPKANIWNSFNFTTADHRTLGKFTLYLHSEDLPEDMDEAEEKLAAYVEEVHLHSGIPGDHHNHQFWVNQKQNMEIFEAQEERWASLREEFSEPTSEVHNVFKNHFEGQHRPGGRIGSEKRSLLQRFHAFFMGRLPYISRLHIFWPDVKIFRQLIKEATGDGSKKTDCLILLSGEPSYRRIGLFPFENINGQHTQLATDTLWSDIFVEGFFDGRMYDLCYCELGFPQLMDFKVIYNRIRKQIKPGGQIIVFFLSLDIFEKNEYLSFSNTQPHPILYSSSTKHHPHDLSMSTAKRFITDSCPNEDESDVWFVGGRLRRFIMMTKAGLHRNFKGHRYVRWTLLAGFFVLTTPVVLMTSMLSRYLPSVRFNEPQTSITMRFKKL